MSDASGSLYGLLLEVGGEQPIQSTPGDLTSLEPFLFPLAQRPSEADGRRWRVRPRDDDSVGGDGDTRWGLALRVPRPHRRLIDAGSGEGRCESRHSDIVIGWWSARLAGGDSLGLAIFALVFVAVAPSTNLTVEEIQIPWSLVLTGASLTIDLGAGWYDEINPIAMVLIAILDACVIGLSLYDNGLL